MDKPNVCDHGISLDLWDACAECKEYFSIMQWLERSWLAEEVYSK